MFTLRILIAFSALSLITACSGGGEGSVASIDSDDSNTILGDGTTNPIHPIDPTSPNEPTPTPTPTPTGPQPGDIVKDSDGHPMATYPSVGTTIDFSINPKVEPNTDIIVPIIAITTQPNPYIPNTTGNVQIWAADDVNGSGLESMECSIDDGSWATCNQDISMAGLSEGIHSIKARATDHDGNQSTEVSYSFYVDTTPPAIVIDGKPPIATTDATANFEFSADDQGSGLNNLSCKISGSTFKNCSANEAFSNLEEGPQKIELLATDNVGNTSTVAEYDWLVDYSAPIVNFTTEPAATVYVENGTNLLNFDISDKYSPDNVTYSCDLNGTAVACNSGANLVIPASDPKNYTFTVTATDSLGNSTAVVRRWTSLNEAEERTTTLTVNGVNPVDILFVVDNSGSMAYERSSLANRIDGFISKVEGLDWQIGIISTDATNYDAKSDGRLLELDYLPGQYILDSSMDTATAQTSFGSTVQNFGGGSGNEEGIYSSQRMIERYLADETPHKDFIRDGADLSIVVLSDEDESSNGNGARITPQEFVDFVTKSFLGTKKMTWHSIISRPGDTACLNGQGANVGNVYAELSNLTGYGETGGAIIGSVCDTDYTAQLADIGQSVRDLANSLTLECSPYDGDKDGEPDLFIAYRATPTDAYTEYTAARTVQNENVTFTDLLPAGDFKAEYRCKIN